MAFKPRTSVALEGCTPLVPRSVPTRKVVALVDRSWDDPGRDYELDRLCAAAPELGVDLRVVDIQDLELLLNGDRLEIRELCSPVPPSARVLVRLGARATDHQLAVLRILESLGVEMEATPAAIRVTQHKLLTAFEVSDLVLTPETLLTSNPFDDATRDFYFGDNWPIVLKVPIGTNGDDVEPVFDAAEYADACAPKSMIISGSAISAARRSLRPNPNTFPEARALWNASWMCRKTSVRSLRWGSERWPSDARTVSGPGTHTGLDALE